MNIFTHRIITGEVKWDKRDLDSRDFVCGYCGAYVASNEGMAATPCSDSFYVNGGGVYICTNCYMPTFLYEGMQVPGNRYGNSVNNVPDRVDKVYEEARSCYAANAYTGTVLLCRKLLMHVAIDLGADDNLKFIEYVNYLNDKHFVSVKSHNWVDQIRKYGNKATHELEVNSQQDAQMILKFCEMLLKMNYEYPLEITNLNSEKN